MQPPPRRFRARKKYGSNNLLDNEIPEKFKDPQSGDVRLDALIQSYKELEKKLSAGKNGAPAAPEDYCINCNHGMFESHPEINQTLHEKGFSQDQAQTVYDLAAQHMMPMLSQVAGDFRADREVEKLVNHFGGPDKWKEVSRQLLAFGQKNLPADVLDSLASSYEGILALYKMMQSQEPGLQKRGKAAESLSATDLTSMMRDPKYWRDKDPAFVAKVTEGFKSVYGG